MGCAITKQVTALGVSKATHEFLTLHYLAIDSADWWEQLLTELIPQARFPGAVVRRAGVGLVGTWAALRAPLSSKWLHSEGFLLAVSQACASSTFFGLSQE